MSENLTPAMRQYFHFKNKYPDCLLLFRMGDFYETFYEDAKSASSALEITLTSRGKGEKRAPLAGIPYHALEPYLIKLIKKGFKVAICEQVEDPKLAKGIVKRDIVRIVTPGTIIESAMLDEKSNNFISSLTQKGEEFGFSLCDMSTGEFIVANISEDSLFNLISRYSPKELIIPASLTVNRELINKIKKYEIFINEYDDMHFRIDNASKKLKDHFNVLTLEGFGLSNELEILASGGLLSYLHETQFIDLSHIVKIQRLSDRNYMELDSSTIKNLELIRNIRDNTIRGTLLSILDKTSTPMGSRLLKSWILHPLTKIEEINLRLNAVETLTKKPLLKDNLINLLKRINDLERLISRINYGNANARDLISLKNSLEQIPKIIRIIDFEDKLLNDLSDIPDFTNLIPLLKNSIRDDPPLSIREGGMIKQSFNQELDNLHNIKSSSKRIILEIEEREKNRTGIKSLKIKFNRVFGYYIEISNSNLNSVPENFIRKQTLVNAERFITEDLKILEEKILTAEEKINSMEFEIFQSIINEVKKHTEDIQETAKKISILDCLLSFSAVSLDNFYTKPEINSSFDIILKESRHPVIETLESNYVSNDINILDGEICLLTGPNMSGKSSILRQVALNVLMGQIGCFVPASHSKIGIVDRIFTRVGAYDDLTMGQSTFMVEMTESANILNNATNRSLIILDEIGRGTSTFDGVSIAWAVVEYIYNKIKAKTMFATHYHVLNKLETQLKRVKNYNLAVKESKEDIIFLRKLIEGGTDKSYGVHVAKLAGLPKEVIERAQVVQKTLEEEDKMHEKINAKVLSEQKKLFENGL